MAQFDVYAIGDDDLVIDLQSSVLDPLNTRLVAPLKLAGTFDHPIPRLNPNLNVGGKSYLMLTQYLAALPVTDLRHRISNLDGERYKISLALDLLFYGF